LSNDPYCHIRIRRLIPTPQGYTFFVMMNSSVRGPFLPNFWPKDRPWTEALTGLLNAEVKLVGPTINCGGGAHIQSTVLATDR
jgi:hypothetical protein